MKQKDAAPGTLKGTLQELRGGTWGKNAQNRAARRKSAWNLLLVLFVVPFWLVLWWAISDLGYLMHFALHHESAPGLSEWMRTTGTRMTLSRALLLFAPALPALSGAMVISNFLIYRIPPARRAMEAEDRGHPGTDYATAQKALGQLTLYAGSVALLLLLAGAWWLR